MAEDPLHDIIEAVRARLKVELDRQLEAMSERHEQALATERQLAHARLEEERRIAAEQLEGLKQTLYVLETERSQAATSAAPQPGADRAGLAKGVRDIDAAMSVSDALSAIARAAAAEMPRSTLFVANGSQLDPWAVEGLSPHASGSLDMRDPAAGLPVRAVRSGEAIHDGGSACAIPLVLDGAAVGVLHGEAADDAGTSDWSAALEVVARHGAARLGYLTALRTAQARQWLADSAGARSSAPRPGSRNDPEDAAASARRYARLVVSEIKLYNERAVQEGRSQRDLQARLGPEIERARRQYEERVPTSLAARSEYFQQELVQTLAGGDPSLLG